ncbi:MAG: hypothetical protein V1875_06235 [Candidatus Altiarchaeota archaeon]
MPDNRSQLKSGKMIINSGYKKILKILAIVGIIIAIIALGLVADNIRNSSSLSLYDLPSFLKESSREAIYDKLTKNSWCTPKGINSYVYSFKPDGTYAWNQFEDYVPSPSGSGRWNFEQNPAGEWFLLYDNGQRLRFTLYRFDRLILEYANLRPCDPITTPRKYDASSLPPVRSPNQDDKKLVANRWKRANDIDLDYEPTLVEFRDNFEYVTTYRYGECQNSGSWYAKAGQIKASSTTDKCDPRDDIYPEAFPGEWSEDGFLLLNNDDDLYVPEDYPLMKGVIWRIFSFSDIMEIKVEYDMPIRAGVPNRFDVEMKNVAKREGPMTIRRFSVTKDYGDYRNTDGSIAQVDEIAGLDLGSRILKPNETYNFSLSVTFEKPGKQRMYLYALVDGRTQKWDFKKNYNINVL